MSNFKEKINNFFFLGEEVESDNEKNQPEKMTKDSTEHINERKIVQADKSNLSKKSGGENVVTIHQKQTVKKPRITIVEPRLYSEVQEVSDVLLNSQSVIINFRRMDNEQATKMIDFLMGVTYAIKGDIQRLGEEIFICTPQNVEVDGSELSEFTESLL